MIYGTLLPQGLQYGFERKKLYNCTKEMSPYSTSVFFVSTLAFLGATVASGFFLIGLTVMMSSSGSGWKVVLPPH